MTALRVALVGAGRWARAAHVPAWRQVQGARLVAVADPDPGRREAVAAELGIHPYPSLAAVLEDEGIDVVDVASATGSHFALAKAAIEAGCHVLCEKPVALAAAQAERLRDLVGARGVVGAVAFAFRHAQAVARLRERLPALGRVYHVQGFEQNSLYHDPAKPRPPARLRADQDVGALGEYGSHLVDLTRWLIGDLVEVAGDARTFIPERAVEGGGYAPSDVDDSTAFLARFAGGAQGLFQASWLAAGRPPGIELRIFGEGGALRLVLAEGEEGGESLLAADVDEGLYRPVDPGQPAEDWPRLYMSRLVASFVRRLGGRADPALADFADAAASQRVLDAVMRSSKSGRWERVDEPAGGG